MLTIPDRWICLYYKDGSVSRIREEDEPIVRQAIERLLGVGVHAWSGVIGEDRDTLLDLHALSGARITTPASVITCWTTSTPECRAAEAETESLLAAEQSTRTPSPEEPAPAEQS